MLTFLGKQVLGHKNVSWKLLLPSCLKLNSISHKNQLHATNLTFIFHINKSLFFQLNELFASLGFLKYRALGYSHSFGVLSHYYGREAGLELREDIDTVIRPGMVVSMEPMLTIPDGAPGAGGYREHDIVVVHHDGSTENITKFPFGPEHNVI